MKFACYSFIFFSLILTQACNKTDLYSQEIKTLDSLSGSLNSMVRELEKPDTILLQKSILRLGYYAQFIKENIHDTITKEQADNLKHFYTGGKNLEAYAKNRQMIIARARWIGAQLVKLKSDIKNNPDPGQLSVFIISEKAEASKLTEIGYRQTAKFHASLEEFKNSLPEVETLIKSRNRGNLPTIIKDSIVL